MATRLSSAARTPSTFLEEVRGDDLDLASYLRIEERELEAGAPSGNVGQSE